MNKTKQQLKTKNIPYKTNNFPFTTNKHTITIIKPTNFIKILTHTKTNHILNI
ncbi:dihydrolipoyl dehydrogenase, partial [Escherichia coli]|nr:dihydrolipoyl dehydrogenase [Escherichia coli]